MAVSKHPVFIFVWYLGGLKASLCTPCLHVAYSLMRDVRTKQIARQIHLSLQILGASLPLGFGRKLYYLGINFGYGVNEENTPFSSICSHSTQNTSVISIGGVFLYQAIIQFFTDQDWVSYNLTHFRCCLPGDSIRSHRSKVGPTRLHPHQIPIVTPGINTVRFLGLITC